MHELSLSQAIARIVARAADGRPVVEVEVDVGALRQVVPATLEHCWGFVIAGSPLAGARLRANVVPASVRCRDCAAHTIMSDLPAMMCGRCGSRLVAVVSGEEFLVRAIEVGEKESANG